ncbi:arylamine N-acetyltransferase [Fredinandcohnia humi]
MGISLLDEKLAMNYLNYLNLEWESPSYDYLERICYSHLHTFPFENISKLLFFKKGEFLPKLDTFLENYREYNFGGTCYSLNSNLLLLLKALGFECYHIKLGDAHIGIIVIIENEKFYVDCGAAAPFFKPVDIENNDQGSTVFGTDCINILPVDQANHEYTYVRYTNGVQSGDEWRFNSHKKQEFSDFTEIISKSYKIGAPFMEILRCQIWQSEKNRSVSLVNNKFTIRYRNGQSHTRTLVSIEEIKNVLTQEFILPKLPVKEAIKVLYELGIDIFFEK